MTSGGQPSNDISVGAPAKNGQTGQTNQSGPSNDQQSNSPAPITIENNGNSPVTTDNGTQPQTSNSSDINWYLGGSSRLSGNYVRAGFDDIRIRSGAGTNYDQLGLLVENHYYPVLQERNGWVQIQGSKGTGWVSLTVVEEFGGSSSSSSSSSSNSTTSSNSSSSLCPSFSAPVSVGDIGRITPGVSNNIRSNAGTSYSNVGQIPAGATFNVIGGPRCNDGYRWWQVNYNGVSGWTADGESGDLWIERVSGVSPLTLSDLEESCVAVSSATLSSIPNNRLSSCVESAIGDITEAEADAITMMFWSCGITNTPKIIEFSVIVGATADPWIAMATVFNDDMADNSVADCLNDIGDYIDLYR